jgi:hypothetical protein
MLETGSFGTGTDGFAQLGVASTSQRGTVLVRASGNFAQPGNVTISAESNSGQTSSVVADAVGGVGLTPSTSGRLYLATRPGYLPVGAFQTFYGTGTVAVPGAQAVVLTGIAPTLAVGDYVRVTWNVRADCTGAGIAALGLQLTDPVAGASAVQGRMLFTGFTNDQRSSSYTWLFTAVNAGVHHFDLFGLAATGSWNVVKDDTFTNLEVFGIR